MLSRAMLRLRALFRRDRVEQELDEELQYHVAKDIERHIAAGMSPQDARSVVARGFGNVEVLKEESRDARGTRWLEDLGQDGRYLIRTVRKSPGFTAAVVLTLAVGIGMTTAIFTIIHGVLLRSLPFDEPGRLVALHTVEEGESDYLLSPPHFMSLREEGLRSFDDIAPLVAFDGTLVDVGGALRVQGRAVGAAVFELLRVRPILGRTFRPEENEPGSERVVMLGYGLWQQRFGGDRRVLGRAIQIDGTSFTVVGVMPPGFHFPSHSALWMPQVYDPKNYWLPGAREGRYVPVLARLRAGVSLEAAQAELRLVGQRLGERFPDSNAGATFTARPLHETLVSDISTPLLLLFAAVVLVLLIACANVAGLLLARVAGRREEVAVRAALGARRSRIVRQLVTESLVLGAVGGALGLLLAFWATQRLVTMWPETQSYLDTIRVDGTVLGFAFGVAIAASLLAGIVPAFRATSGGLAATLQSGGRSGLAAQRGQRFRSTLVVAQLGLAVVLLVGAGLLLESFVRLTSVDSGFHTEKVLSFRLDLPNAVYGGADVGDRPNGSGGKTRTFYGQLLKRIEHHPGVRSVGTISRLPIDYAGSFDTGFRIEGRALPTGEDLFIAVRIVSPAYFDTMGVSLLRGRGVVEQDGPEGLPIIVINEAAAKRFFPGEDPIGRRLLNFWYDPIEVAADAFTIVGVVADVRSRGLREQPQPEAYFAHAQVPLATMSVVVRAAGDPLALAGTIRRELKALDSNIPAPEFQTFEQVVADSVARPRFMTTLLSLFSAVALILAAVGIFGLLSFAVAQRRHEIGIRIALGASPRALIGTVVRNALVLVVIGLAIGIGGALALTRVLEAQLYGVSATDPVTFTLVTLVLGGTALMASLIPAWRAATVDPLVALRAE